MSDIRPRWDDDVPWCSDSCPKHDGKRCEVLSHRPDAICRPAVREVVAEWRLATWLRRIERLQPGDRCEFRYPARQQWLPGVVVMNGGASYWSIRDESDAEGRRGQVQKAIVIEHVRLPGQTEAWPGYTR